jgi:hypothetical protein
MRTKCKQCIFGAFENNKQVGCVLGRLDIYKAQGVHISRELVETTDREYYVINDRYCMACRNDKWLNSLPEGTDHVEEMEKEMAIRCQIIVFSNNNLSDVHKTVESIERQTLKAAKITIADRPENSSAYDDKPEARAEYVKSILAKINHIETPYEVRSFTEEFHDGKCIDLCVENAQPQYYCVVQAGYELPETMLEDVNHFVNKQIVQFSLIAADEHNNFMVVPHSVHTYLRGNLGKPLVEKIEELEEWKQKVYQIQTVCASTQA